LDVVVETSIYCVCKDKARTTRKISYYQNKLKCVENKIKKALTFGTANQHDFTLKGVILNYYEWRANDQSSDTKLLVFFCHV